MSRNTTNSNHGQLTVLSHNICQYLPPYSNIDALIRNNAADIVLLQEITHPYITRHLPTFTQTYPYQNFGPLLPERLVGMVC